MSAVSVTHYEDAEGLECAYTATRVRLTPTGRGPFDAEVVRVELGKTWLQRVLEGAPRVKVAEHDPRRAFFRFQIEPGPPLIIDGSELSARSIMYADRSDSYVERTTGRIWWGALSLPIEDLTAAGIAVAGQDITSSYGRQMLLPPSATFSRLLALHSAVGDLARHRSEILLSPEVKRALEQSLVEAVVACFDGQLVKAREVGREHRSLIMRRFHRVIEANPDRALYVPEICAIIGVPERTLRLACEQHLGMSPKVYLQRRRMHLAHRALRAAVPDETTVTAIATQFGFWHLGRFAVCHRAMFGEAPSAALGKSSHPSMGTRSQTHSRTGLARGA